MKKYLGLLLLFAASLGSAQVYTYPALQNTNNWIGLQIFGGGIVLPRYTVSTLPSGPSIGQVAIVTNGVTASDCTAGGGTNYAYCVYNGSAWISLGSTYPPAGIPVSTGSGWGTSFTAPGSALVGITDTQTLTNKTLDGVSPTTFGFLDATSSIQTQLNGKEPSLGNPASSGYVLTSTAGGVRSWGLVALTSQVTGVLPAANGGAPNLKFAKAVGCSTGSAAGNQCTVVVTWPSAYPDTNYVPVCWGTGANGPWAIVQTGNKSTGSITVYTTNMWGTSGSSSFTEVDCMANE